MRELTFQFSDLPAFTERGFGFGSFHGEADIRYDRNGEWSIGEIRIEGSRYRTQIERLEKLDGIPLPTWEHKLVTLCEKSHRDLYLSLFAQLESGEWKDKIEGEVVEALEQEGVSLLANYADHLHDMRAAE